MMGFHKRYTDYNTYLRKRFGQRVQKIAVDAGLSCPNRDGTLSAKGCIYCNAKGSGSGLWAKGVSIRQQIAQKKIGAIKKYKAKKFLAYFQSYSNTYASCDQLKKIYDEALSEPGMVGMAIGTRPDCVDAKKLDLLQSYTKNYLVWLEYGVQTIHDQTLDLINRQHDFQAFVRAVKMTQNRGISICAHLILGLPGEDHQMMLDSARKLADLGIDGIKIHLLYVIKKTHLDQMWKNKMYVPMTQQAYVQTVCDIIEQLPKEMIIQRITGDPHLDELRAPQWAGRYRETFNLIQQTLEQRDSYQGKRFSPHTMF
jgi:radical SAM protein (TIGR01212 family)